MHVSGRLNARLGLVHARLRLFHARHGLLDARHELLHQCSKKAKKYRKMEIKTSSVFVDCDRFFFFFPVLELQLLEQSTLPVWIQFFLSLSRTSTSNHAPPRPFPRIGAWCDIRTDQLTGRGAGEDRRGLMREKERVRKRGVSTSRSGLCVTLS